MWGIAISESTPVQKCLGSLSACDDTNRVHEPLTFRGSDASLLGWVGIAVILMNGWAPKTDGIDVGVEKAVLFSQNAATTHALGSPLLEKRQWHPLCSLSLATHSPLESKMGQWQRANLESELAELNGKEVRWEPCSRTKKFEGREWHR